MKFLKTKIFKMLLKTDTTDYTNKIDALIKGIGSVKISFNKNNNQDD